MGNVVVEQKHENDDLRKAISEVGMKDAEKFIGNTKDVQSKSVKNKQYLKELFEKNHNCRNLDDLLKQLDEVVPEIEIDVTMNPVMSPDTKDRINQTLDLVKYLELEKLQNSHPRDDSVPRVSEWLASQNFDR